MKRSLIVDTHASSCYFRTSIAGEGRKALVQITERCNLHCGHCFVSSGDWGDHMPLELIVDRVIPRLKAAGVQRLTLTGGEPFVHPNIMAICRAVRSAGLPLGICTNATSTSDDQIAELVGLGDVHVNVSFDGFRPESHGKFRGDRSSFATTVETTRKFAEAGLLQGLLSTPNALSEPEEFADLCAFASDIGAQYVLMNPLSPFGRGIASQGRLAADEDKMRAIAAVTARFDRPDMQTVRIRFPNEDKPLGGCDAGKIIYVFTRGQVAVCPYLVFAARNPVSRYLDQEFMVGNILEADVAGALDDYRFHRRFRVGANATCRSCAMDAVCGKGCPAAVVARGERIGEVDSEQCSIVSSPKRSIPLAVKR
ncbi:radical SAM protein [Glycomyces luteolus]|uniref:Radical SAM protein n=1 Tax=Glycomyces luteolus TaxID=2670330 RepID=A0A9X3PA05_9ACTN|nr:radical SAM protein [Glycomyces luteolus]MDA1359747.1 radical SAM protein [Glycomyces luteolus]